MPFNPSVLKIAPNHKYWFRTYSISQEICTRFLLCCALLWLYIDCFSPYPSGLLHWHCGNLTIAPVPAKQPWWIWINTSCEFIINDCITTTKQSTTKPCAYFLGYTVHDIVCGAPKPERVVDGLRWLHVDGIIICLQWVNEFGLITMHLQ